MPTLMEDAVIEGFAWCNARAGGCVGYAQRKVPLNRVTVGRTFADGLAGKGTEPWHFQMMENTTSYLAFVNPEDATCPHCGHAMEKSDQQRPSYSDSSAEIEQLAASRAAEDNRSVRLESELAELRGQMAELLKRDAG